MADLYVTITIPYVLSVVDAPPDATDAELAVTAIEAALDTLATDRDVRWHATVEVRRDTIEGPVMCQDQRDISL